MNTDSSVNVIVFEVLVGRRLQQFLGECATRATDGLHKVWIELSGEFVLQPKNVRRVYSQWEPTPADRAFLANDLPPTVKVYHSFHRPSSRRDWGNGTPEFEQAVEEFERTRFVTKTQSQNRQPWWQYWEC